MKVVSTILLATLGLAACASSGSQVACQRRPTTAPPASTPAPANYGPCSDRTAAASVPLREPHRSSNPASANAISFASKARPQRTCWWARGKGTRETQVLYSEAGGRELYLFVNNRLDRMVK